MKSGRQNGFTLIELMITVAIVGILATIAYPSYTQYMFQARRADAQSDMLQIQLALEKFRANRVSYRSDATTTNVAITNTIAIVLFTDSNTYHDYTITGTTGSAYIINAAAQGSQTGDTGCTALTLTQSSVKGPAGCWKGS